MVTVLLVSAKITTLGLLKIKVFWNKGYDVIIFVQDIMSKTFSLDSSEVVDVVMLSKFGKSSTFMREVIITSIPYEFGKKYPIFLHVVVVQVQ